MAPGYQLLPLVTLDFSNLDATAAGLTALGPGSGEPFGAGSLEAGGAGLWFVGLVAAAVWELFEHTPFQAGTHNLTLAQATPTCSIALLPLLFHPVGGAVSVTTGIDGQRAQRLVTLLL